MNVHRHFFAGSQHFADTNRIGKASSGAATKEKKRKNEERRGVVHILKLSANLNDLVECLGFGQEMEFRQMLPREFLNQDQAHCGASGHFVT